MGNIQLKNKAQHKRLLPYRSGAFHFKKSFEQFWKETDPSGF